MSKTITDKKKIDELLSRSIDTVYPSKEELKKELLSGRRLRVYAGVDATGKSLHLGHAINYQILKRFHELGHQVVALVGDFTAMIGDPTDRGATRVRLTREEVEENFKAFKLQIGKILDFGNEDNPVEFLFNSSWLGRLTFEEVIDIASNFTVQQMIERDTFQKRISEKKPLYVHEFFYPFMQGYDSVAMGVDVEVGGTDQTFNMLAGRTLMKRYLNKEKFVITHPLLENPKTGEVLMSKSKGTGIMLDDSPAEMYGKTMALPDEGILILFKHCTNLTERELAGVEERLEKGENPRDLKMELAREIVSMYHSKEDALDAEKSFVQAFQEGGVPSDIRSVSVVSGSPLQDVVVREGLVKSKSQFSRLVGEGAVRLIDGEEVVVGDPKLTISNPVVVKVGKKRFIKIDVEG